MPEKNSVNNAASRRRGRPPRVSTPSATEAVKPENSPDPVHAPTHYTQGEIECIDAIRSALGEEGFKAYCKGNVIKYVWRHNHKSGSEGEDLAKAAVYLGWAEEGKS